MIWNREEAAELKEAIHNMHKHPHREHSHTCWSLEKLYRNIRTVFYFGFFVECWKLDKKCRYEKKWSQKLCLFPRAHFHTTQPIVHFPVPSIDRQWFGYIHKPTKPDVKCLVYSLAHGTFLKCIRDLDRCYHFHEGMLVLKIPLLAWSGVNAYGSTYVKRQGAEGDNREEGRLKSTPWVYNFEVLTLRS